MPTFTALTLVNRVRRRMHMGDAADLTDRLSLVLLDLINESKDYVLETRSWDFDSFHDGVLITQAVVDYTSTAVTNLATGFTGGTFTPGDYVARLIVTSDTSQSETAYRILTTSAGAGVLDSAWLGSTAAASATSRTFFAEYKLPDTVKDVLSVRYQDDDLELKSIGRDVSFHSIVPRMHDEISDDPRVVVVGSQVTPTYATGGTASTPGLGLLIYPTPLTSYRIDYSYTVRHPALTSSQDLENVPDSVVHDIVLEAEALAYGSSVANDPDLAERAHRRVEVRSSRHHQVNTADPLRRTTLRSLDSKGGPSTFGHRPNDEDVFA